MAAYLDDPAIASAVSSKDLVAGLEVWKQEWGAHKILQHLDAHCLPGDELVDYALDVIQRRDYLRMGVLSESRSLHDVKLIEPLMAWTTDPTAYSVGTESALVLLSKQLDLAPDRDALTKKLGAVWLDRSPTVRRGIFKTENTWRWVDEIDRLALTRDKNLVPVLLPYLDRKEVAIDARKLQAFNDGVSIRICDITYNAISNILGHDGERFSIGHGLNPAQNPQQVYARRDLAIDKLKQELAAVRR